MPMEEQGSLPVAIETPTGGSVAGRSADSRSAGTLPHAFQLSRNIDQPDADRLSADTVLHRVEALQAQAGHGQAGYLSGTALANGTVSVGRMSLQVMLPEAQLSKLLGSMGQHLYQIEHVDGHGLLRIEGDAGAIRDLLAVLGQYLEGRQAVVVRDADAVVLGRYIYEPETGHLVHTSNAPIGGGASAFALNRLDRLSLDSPADGTHAESQSADSKSAGGQLADNHAPAHDATNARASPESITNLLSSIRQFAVGRTDSDTALHPETDRSDPVIAPVTIPSAPSDSVPSMPGAGGTVPVPAVHLAPQLTGLAASVTFLENTVNAAGQKLNSSLTLTDADTYHFGGGMLSVGYTGAGLAEDSLSFDTTGPVSIAGSDVRVSGLVVGTILSSGTTGTALALQLTGNATPVTLEILLENLTYANSSDTPAASRIITITLDDGDSASTSQSITVNVTPESDNSAPVAVADAASTAEDTPLNINIATLIANDSDVEQALTGANFALTTTGSHGTVVNNGDGTLTYTPTADYNGADSFTYTITDSGGLTSTATVSLTITPVNDAPVITGLATSVTFLENTVNAAPQLIDSSIALTDIDSTDFSGGTLTISYSAAGLAQDSLGFDTSGTVSIAGANVSVGGVLVGVLTSTGAAGADLALTLNASATPARIDTLIEALTYANSSNNPTAARTVVLTLADGDGGSFQQNITVNVTPENDNGPVTLVGSGIVDAMVLQTVNNATWSMDLSTAFADADAPNETLSYSIVTNYKYGTGDPSTWAAANFVTLNSSTGVLTLNRALLVGDEGAVYLTIRATDSTAHTLDESFELFVADGSVNSTGTYNPGPGATTGNDTISGVPINNEWFWGDSGADSINSQHGNDTIHGGDGNDTLYGGAHGSTLYGGAGGDDFSSAGGADLMYGGDGNDILNSGNGGADKVYGGDGDDTITATHNTAKLMYGQAGNDLIYFANATYLTNADTLSGGIGLDTLRLTSANTSALTANFATGQWDKVSGIETFDLQANAAHSLTFNDQYLTRGTGIEGKIITVSASTIATGITVNASGMTDATYAVSVTGGTGDDTVYATAGADNIALGTGTDTVYINTVSALASLASDTLSGGVSGHADELRFSAGIGNVTLDLTTLTTIKGFENISFYNAGINRITLDNGYVAREALNGTQLTFYNIASTQAEFLASAVTHTVSFLTYTATNDLYLAGSGNDGLNFYSSSTLTSADTFSGGAGTDTVNFAGSAASTLNTASYFYFDGFENFNIKNDVAGNVLAFDDGYFTRGAGITGNKVTVTYAYSGTATNGMLVDGRLITNSSYMLNVTGDEAADTIYGGAGADTVSGGASAGINNDVIYGNGGNDSLTGGDGRSTIYGGEGNDYISTISTAWNNSFFSGGEGNDTISGANQTSVTIQGGEGDDVITGSNYVNGAVTPDDTIDAGEGNDTVYGMRGNDRITGSYGADVLWGGASSIAGSGQNMFIYNDPNESTTTETDIIKDFGAGGDDDKLLIFGFTGIQAAAGVAAAGTVLGWTNNTDATGNGENDIVITSAMNDFKIILEGAGTGADNINLTDNTNIFFNAASRTQLGLGAITGSFIMGTSGDDSGGSALNGTANSDYVMGLEGNDYFNSNAGNDLFYGGAGNDTFSASGTSADTIYGGDGADSIDAGAGNDLVYGGDSNDWIQTGDGNDTTYGGAGNDTILSSVGGNETIYGGDGADSVSVTYVGAGRTIYIDLGAGNDTLSSFSNSGTVYGGDGDDSITLGNSNHTVYGGAGNDYIQGGLNADALFGGAGSDTLIGGSMTAVASGLDQLTGGSGADIFFYGAWFGIGPSHPNNRDIITDFSGSSGEGDNVDLSTMIGGTFTFAGSIAMASSGAAFAMDDSVRYYQDSGGGRTIIQITTSVADGNLTTTDMEIELTGLHTLTASDFVL